MRKIKELEGEISSIKIQKVTATRKWKEESEKHNILRKQKHEEILKIKKANLKKDQEIDRLRKDNKKKDILQRRKVEEIAALKKQNDFLLMKKASATKQRRDKL